MGRHAFRVREIATQAGLSEATVDRVLNGRPGVRASTRDQVREAIADLERQRSQLRLDGRTFLVDVVMDAPHRFSAAVRAALERQLPTLRPALVRARFHLREDQQAGQLTAVLDRIAARGSAGVILKAPDVPEVVAAANRLVAAGIPVVTFVTDLPTSRRRDYAGTDNRAAGATAAYLLQQWLRDRDGDILLTLSSGSFRGEEEREMGFRAGLRAGPRPRAVVEVSEAGGLDRLQRDLVSDALRRHPGVRAVYSIGGGNIATLAAFDAARRPCDVFVAHDLDEDNLTLLRDRRLSAVLHHDLDADLRSACQVILQAGNAIPAAGPLRRSAVQVVTPFNLPADLAG